MARGERLTVDGTVRSFADTTWEQAVSGIIRFEDGPVRWYADGRTPTATEGFWGYDNDAAELATQFEIKWFKAIRSGVTNGTVEIMVRK